MSYASNCPISRPANVANWDVYGDFNGILWSNMWGFGFAPTDEALPIREPSPWMPGS